MLKRLAVLFITGSIAMTSLAEELPLLGSATSGLTQEQERQLGQAWLRALRRQVNLYDNAMFQDYLDERLSLLIGQAQLNDNQFSSVVLFNPELNAFAVTGNIIGIQTGLLLNIDTEPELLAVLAHEIGHLQQRHYNRIRENSKQQQALQLSSMLATILLIQVDPELASATLFSGSASAISNQLKFSRDMEIEADRVGQTIMVNSGYDASSVTKMLEQLQKSTLLAGTSPVEYLSTHPLSENRIADSRQHRYPIRLQAKSDNLEFQYHRLRIQALHSQDTKAFNASLKRRLEQNEHQEERSAIRLLYAEQAGRENNYQLAFEQLEQVQKRFPNSRLVRAINTRLTWQSGQTEMALNKIQSLRQEFPSGIALGLMEVEILLDMGQDDRALQVLRELSRQAPLKPMIWEQLSIIEAQRGNAWQSFRAQIEYLWLNGHEQKAMRQAQFALKNKNWSAQERSRLNDRFVEMQRELDAARF